MSLNTLNLPIGAIFLIGVVLTVQPDKLNITPEEHAACDQDAERLCADSYPDENKLLACMKAKRHQLSPVCSTTFAAGLKRRHLSP